MFDMRADEDGILYLSGRLDASQAEKAEDFFCSRKNWREIIAIQYEKRHSIEIVGDF